MRGPCGSSTCYAMTEVDCALSHIGDFSDMVEAPEFMARIWTGPTR